MSFCAAVALPGLTILACDRLVYDVVEGAHQEDLKIFTAGQLALSGCGDKQAIYEVGSQLAARFSACRWDRGRMLDAVDGFETAVDAIYARLIDEAQGSPRQLASLEFEKKHDRFLGCGVTPKGEPFLLETSGASGYRVELRFGPWQAQCTTPPVFRGPSFEIDHETMEVCRRRLNALGRECHGMRSKRSARKHAERVLRDLIAFVAERSNVKKPYVSEETDIVTVTRWRVVPGLHRDKVAALCGLPILCFANGFVWVLKGAGVV